MTTPLTTQVNQRSGDDDLDHIVCCDDNRALCGTDVSTATWRDTPTTCVVCQDLEQAPCSVVCAR